MENNTEVGIVFEDADLLVLNKPAGVTVNTSDTTTGEKTLQNFIEDYRGLPTYVRQKTIAVIPTEGKEETYISPEETFISRAGIAHRLDKETSGIILVAKTVESFVGLQAQFKERTVEKTYVALAHGKFGEQKGEINVPVGRLPWNRKHFGVLSGGREALTFYEVETEYLWVHDKEKEVLSFVRLHPKTGRTHQIRVHLKYINHPIFGDYLYAGRKTARDDRKVLSRVFLHAASISFTHPKTNEQLHFEAPLPSELQQVLDGCEKI